MSLVFALLLSIGPLGASVQPTTGAPGVYIAVGDSIALGIGSSLPRERSYPAILRDWMAEELGAEVTLENLAVSGETAASFLSDEQLSDLRGAVESASESGIPVLAVTVSLGGNEILDLQDADDSERQAALEEFASNFPDALDAIFDTVGRNVPVVTATVYDPTDTPALVERSDGWWIARFNEVIVEASAEHGAIVADVAAAFGDDAASLTRYPADVHPTNGGHWAIAATVWRALGWDQEAPELSIVSPSEVARATPTVRFTIGGSFAPDSLAVSLSDGFAYSPIEFNGGDFVVLLDLSGSPPQEITLEVRAADWAGNESVARQTLTFTRPEP